LKFLSDNAVNNPEDRIKLGMTIHSRIKRIEPERFSVELTSKTSDLRDLNDQWKPKKDEFYDIRAQENDQIKLEEKKKKEEHKQTYTKRVIAHPQFKNVGYQQAVNYLNGMEIGECIIRPSSKGVDHLTVTWKVNLNCYQHVDVLEEKKMNAFSVGKRLIIDGEDFEDLDEIIARYINPMANYVREIMSHKNYQDLNDNSQNKRNGVEENMTLKNQNIEKYLLDERTKNPIRIPYVFTCCINYPGKFMISYMVKLKVRSEYITVTHEGFKFRLKIFKMFNELLSWFKLHFNDPLPISSNISSQVIQSQPQNQFQDNQVFGKQQQLTKQFSSIQIKQTSSKNTFDDIAFNSLAIDRNNIESNINENISNVGKRTETSNMKSD
jgi:transcription elongation factor SPT6